MGQQSQGRCYRVRPIQTTQSEERGFYLLVPKEVPLSRAGTLFRDWIVSEAKGRSDE